MHHIVENIKINNIILISLRNFIEITYSSEIKNGVFLRTAFSHNDTAVTLIPLDYWHIYKLSSNPINLYNK